MSHDVDNPHFLTKSKARAKLRRRRPLELHPALRQALEALAESEDYSLETMVALLLCEALTQRLRNTPFSISLARQMRGALAASESHIPSDEVDGDGKMV